MFETAELGRSVGKEEFEAEVPKLRLELLEAQRELQKAGCRSCCSSPAPTARARARR